MTGTARPDPQPGDTMNDTTEPQAGDHVILRGTIKTIHEGVALVEVYRTYPVGGRIAVQCGALELDESVHDGDVPAAAAGPGTTGGEK